MSVREEALTLPRYGGGLPPVRQPEETDPKQAFETQYRPLVYQVKNIAEALQADSIEFKPQQRYVVLTPANINQAGYGVSFIDFTQSSQLNRMLLTRYQAEPTKLVYETADHQKIFVLIGTEDGAVNQQFITALQSLDDIRTGVAANATQELSDEDREVLAMHTLTQLAVAKLCYSSYESARYTGEYRHPEQLMLFYYSVQINISGGLSPAQVAECMAMEPVPLEFLETYQPLSTTDKKLLPSIFTKIKQRFTKSIFKENFLAQQTETKKFDLSIKNMTANLRSPGQYQVLLAIKTS